MTEPQANAMADMLKRDQESEDQELCPFGLCDGSGECSEDVWDEDSHNYQRGVGIKKCLCKSKEPSED